MQRLTCTLTLYMNVCNFLRSLPSLVCRDCDMVCVCVCIIVPLGTASQHFSMLGIPLRGPIIPMGKSNILKKKKKIQKTNWLMHVPKSLIYMGIYSVSCFQDHFQGVETGSRTYIYHDILNCEALHLSDKKLF